MEKHDMSSRRNVLKITGTAAIGVTTGLAGCTSGGNNDGGGSGGGTTGSSNGEGDSLPDELNILSWGVYQIPELINSFEEKYDITVNFETSASNADILNKVRQSPEGTYDLVQGANYMFETAIDEGMTQPINTDYVPAYEDHVFDRVKQSPRFKKSGDLHAIPVNTGPVGLMYNHETTDLPKQETLGNSYIPTDELWNSKYKGKMTTADKAKYQIFYSALNMGQDPNDTEWITSNIDQVTDNIKTHVDLVTNYWTSMTSIVQNVQSGSVEIGATWDAAARILRDEGEPVSYALLDEGTLFWMDGSFIPKGGNQKAGAYYTQHILSPEYARTYLEGSNLAVLASSVDYSEEERQNWFIDGDALENNIYMNGLGQETRQEYQAAWTRIKANT